MTFKSEQLLSEIRSEHGKEKLKLTWKPFEESDNKSFFVIKDTIPDGNCQFRAISQAILNGTNHRQLRKLIAEYINELPDAEFREIVNHYRIEKTNGEFVGKWDPFRVKTKNQLMRHVKKSGFHFQGDNITLSLLSKILNIDFIIMTETHVTELSNTHDKIIILYYSHNHYKTIGIKQEGIRKVMTLFERHALPDTLRLLIDKDFFLHNEIRNYYDKCKSEEDCHFTLSNLYKYLQHKKKSFSIDKTVVAKIVNDLIQINKSKKSVSKKVSPKKLTVSPKKSVSLSPKKVSPKKMAVRVRKTSHKY
jgi:hypothetical protein